MARGRSIFGQAEANQADWRRLTSRLDRHGRKWFLNIEKETGDPIRMLPSGWSDPLRTPDQYIIVGPDGTPTITYDRWLADLRAANQNWVDTRDAIGRAEMDVAYDPDNPHPKIVRAAGPKPRPDMRLVELARDGDRRLLGLEPMPCSVENYLGWLEHHGNGKVTTDETVDPEYAAFLDTDPSWPEFAAFWAKRNVSRKDAGVQWNALKTAGAVGAA